MDRALLIEHLEMAQRHVVQGKGHIPNQEHQIEVLRSLGAATNEAEELLVISEQSQALHVAHSR